MRYEGLTFFLERAKAVKQSKFTPRQSPSNPVKTSLRLTTIPVMIPFTNRFQLLIPIFGALFIQIYRIPSLYNSLPECKIQNMIYFGVTVPELEVGDADDLHGVADQLRHLHAAPLHPAVDEQTRGESQTVTWEEALFIY